MRRDLSKTRDRLGAKAAKLSQDKLRVELFVVNAALR